jgi:hypothetical protein
MINFNAYICFILVIIFYNHYNLTKLGKTAQNNKLKNPHISNSFLTMKHQNKFIN